MARNLNQLIEIPDPYKYDGCYTVVERLSEIYSQEYDAICNNLDEQDLNALLFMCIGTWKLSAEKKEEKISNSNLSSEGKNEILNVISDVDNKAKNNFYIHTEGGGLESTWGLFGTGTFTVTSVMDDNTYKEAAKNFVFMIKQMLSSDREEASLFEIADDFAQHKYGGLQTGLVSQFLHCLYPFVFPILNSWGRKVYSQLGVDLIEPEKLSNYIENCKAIKNFRDTKTNVKNYRVFDIMFLKPTLAELIKKFLSDYDISEDWKNDYANLIPKYIEEASTGKDWANWDSDTFRNFMSAYNGVSSLRQGNFTDNDKKSIKAHWSELSSHLAQIAKNQDGNEDPNFKEYDTIKRIIKKYTVKDMKAATYRMVAAIQPQFLCTIVQSKYLYQLYSYIHDYTCEELEPYTGDWFKDSFNMLKLFKNAMPDKSVYDIVTIPWQMIDFFKDQINCKNSFMTERDKCQKFLERNYNMILTGAPGTGKTYLARQIAANMLGFGDSLEMLNGDTHFAFTQFHPSYDYVDFVEGLRPSKKEGEEFEYKRGCFKEFCAKAAQDLNSKYIFVIDEINRGNISKIFGELFFAVDPEYRMPCNRMLVKTQYQNMVEEDDVFKDGFFVPENVYIIGTMNDIDRSVETLDFAFRRRFPTIEVKVNDTIDAMCSNISNINGDNSDISLQQEAKDRLEKLNRVISNDEGLGTAYNLGASYMLKLNKLDDIKDRSERFQDLWDYYIENVLIEYLRGFEAGEIKEKIKSFADAFGVEYKEND